MKSLYTRVGALLLLALMPFAFGLTTATAQDLTGDTAGAELAVSGTIDIGNTGSNDDGTFQGHIFGLVASEGPNGITLDGTMHGVVLLTDETYRLTDLQFTRDITPSVVGASDPNDMTADATGCDVLIIDDTHEFTLEQFDLDVTSFPYVLDTVDFTSVSDQVCALGETLSTTPDDTAAIVSQLNDIFLNAGLAGTGGPLPEETTAGTPPDTGVEGAETPVATEEATEEGSLEENEVAPTEEATEDVDEGDMTPTEAADEGEEEGETDKPILESTPAN